MINLCTGKMTKMGAWGDMQKHLVTPVDMWRSGVELWFRSAEAQMDLTMRMMSALNAWDAGTLAARQLKPGPRAEAAAAPAAEPAPKPAEKPVLKAVPTPAPAAKAPEGEAAAAPMAEPAPAAAPARKPVARRTAAKPASDGEAAKPAPRRTAAKAETEGEVAAATPAPIRRRRSPAKSDDT